MAINRYYTPAQSQPFDPYVVDTATMYGNLRQAGYENLLAKQQVDVSTQQDLGKQLSALQDFAPVNDVLKGGGHSGEMWQERSSLKDEYSDHVQSIYQKANELSSKYNNNYASPEAQEDTKNFLKEVNSVLPTLKEIKEADKGLEESNKYLIENHKKSKPSELEISDAYHNANVDNAWGRNRQRGVYNRTAVTPMEGVDRGKHLHDFIADKLINKYKTDVGKITGLTSHTGPTGVTNYSIDHQRLSKEQRTRLLPELLGGTYNKKGEYIPPKEGEDKGLLGAYMSQYPEMVDNPALLEHQLSERRVGGYKTSKDAEKSYTTARDNQFNTLKKLVGLEKINDKTTIYNETGVQVDELNDFGIGAGGKPINRPFVTPTESFKVENVNPAAKIAKTDDEGNIFAHNKKKVTQVSLMNKPINKNVDFATPKDLNNWLKTQGYVLEGSQENVDNIKKVFQGGFQQGIANKILNVFGIDMLKVVNKKTGKVENMTLGTDEGNRLNLSNSNQVKNYINTNSKVKEAFELSNMDINDSKNHNKTALNIALKSYNSIMENTNNLNMNAWAYDEQNAPLVAKKLYDNLNVADIRLPINATLNKLLSTTEGKAIVEDLEKLSNDSNDKSLQGVDLVKILGEKGYRIEPSQSTANKASIGSGQFTTPLATEITYRIVDKDDNFVGDLPVYQSDTYTNNNSSPPLKALASFNRALSGNELKDGFKTKEGFIFKGNVHKVLDESTGLEVLEPDDNAKVIVGNTSYNYNQWKRQQTNDAMLQDMSNNGIVGSKPSAKSIETTKNAAVDPFNNNPFGE